jgi:hypothetical protein
MRREQDKNTSGFGKLRTEVVGERRAQKQESKKTSNGMAGALVIGWSVSRSESMQREGEMGL